MSGNVIDETRAGVDVMLDVDDTAIQLLHGILDGDAGAVLPRDKSMSESEKQSLLNQYAIIQKSIDQYIYNDTDDKIL